MGVNKGYQWKVTNGVTTALYQVVNLLRFIKYIFEPLFLIIKIVIKTL